MVQVVQSQNAVSSLTSLYGQASTIIRPPKCTVENKTNINHVKVPFPDRRNISHSFHTFSKQHFSENLEISESVSDFIEIPNIIHLPWKCNRREAKGLIILSVTLSVTLFCGNTTYPSFLSLLIPCLCLCVWMSSYPLCVFGSHVYFTTVCVWLWLCVLG